MRSRLDPAQAKIRIGEIEIKYYLREPSPDHWQAIGVVSDADSMPYGPTSTASRMFVGAGSTADEAIGDLIARVLTMSSAEAGGDENDVSSATTLTSAF
jgi:hypothetical protein